MPTQPKVFLITGCSSGLGYSLAKAAIAAGHKVIATSRNPSKTPEKVAEITSLGGLWAALDVSSPSLETQFQETILPLAKGKIDAVINNAAIGLTGVVEDIEIDAARGVFETNVWGIIRLSKLLVPLMRAQGGGSIVNISSTTGVLPIPNVSVYSATKAAVDAFTLALAAEVAPFNIRVLITTPAGIRTPFADNSAAHSSSSLRSEYRGTEVEAMVKMVEDPAAFKIDPDRMSEVVVHAVDGTGPFEGKPKDFIRVPFGDDALRMIKVRVDELNAAMENFSGMAQGVDVLN
ncbi:hypothetical protein KVR01_012363 [Diaporthe batatas]|uniref:uncharacterized protein n=1 Tax=Diaporthe batatas TaxID=748121 RepID=UPI001D05B1D4|nr:uncharacterized protein KVR01_012363 [Diaporthe batatas]KAG8157701.1 hypothetical protein KVR01_012363 [Diaporthe batatas]